MGFRRVYRFEDARAYAEELPDILRAPGPTFVHAVLRDDSGRPVLRGQAEEAAYLRSSLAESARGLRKALGV
jgi:hypothetical protein